MELIPEREGGEALGAHAWAFSAVPFTEVQVCSFILYKDVFLFVEGSGFFHIPFMLTRVVAQAAAPGVQTFLGSRR